MLGDSCEDYREVWKRFRARFIAEEPQLGAVSVSTLRRFMTDEDIFGACDDMWKYHTRSNPALSTHLYDISIRFAQSILGEFVSAEDRCFKLRYLQYEWVRLTMEQLRREMWFCSGLIYWMLNDCWPAASGWALVDYYNRPKDAWYAFKRCAGKTVLSLDFEDGRYVLYASNEGAAVQNAHIRVLIVDQDSVREIAEFHAGLAGASAAVVGSWQLELEQNEILVAEISAGALRDSTFYRHGALRMLPTSVHTEHWPDEQTVSVRADRYVHAVELEGECVFEDNCFSLLPGETRKIGYRRLQPGEITVTAYTIIE